MDNKITITRRFQFCAGHRVHRHESKCNNLHGHNYILLVEASPEDGLDHLGRVMDFSEVKSRLGSWIDANWDHGFILSREDQEAQQAMSMMERQKLYLMESNPTAENMGLHLINEICPVLFLGSGVKITKVTIWETENCYAEVSA